MHSARVSIGRRAASAWVAPLGDLREPAVDAFPNLAGRLGDSSPLSMATLNAEPTLVSRLVSELGFFASKLENLVDTWTLMLVDDAEQEAPNARWIERTGDGADHD